MAQPKSLLEEACFTEDAFKTFLNSNDDASTDATVMSTVLPMITGQPNICTANNLLFNNLQHLIDGSISQSTPSRCDGLRPTEIDSQIRNELGPYICAIYQPYQTMLAQFLHRGKYLLAGCKATERLQRLQQQLGGPRGTQSALVCQPGRSLGEQCIHHHRYLSQKKALLSCTKFIQLYLRHLKIGVLHDFAKSRV